MQVFAKEWVEYPFNPIALASTAVAKESLFCNAIANVQCERKLKHRIVKKNSTKKLSLVVIELGTCAILI